MRRKHSLIWWLRSTWATTWASAATLCAACSIPRIPERDVLSCFSSGAASKSAMPSLVSNGAPLPAMSPQVGRGRGRGNYLTPLVTLQGGRVWHGSNSQSRHVFFLALLPSRASTQTHTHKHTHTHAQVRVPSLPFFSADTMLFMALLSSQDYR